MTTTHFPLLLFTVTCHRSQSKGALHVHRPHQAAENPTLRELQFLSHHSFSLTPNFVAVSAHSFLPDCSTSPTDNLHNALAQGRKPAHRAREGPQHARLRVGVEGRPHPGDRFCICSWQLSVFTKKLSAEHGRTKPHTESRSVNNTVIAGSLFVGVPE